MKVIIGTGYDAVWELQSQQPGWGMEKTQRLI
jgi:hypothetical protein